MEKRKGYINMALHVILSLFTVGIWQYIWIYKVTKFLNSVTYTEKRSPVKKLLLCMFVPFYWIYWTHRTAQLIEEYEGEYSSFPTVCSVWAFFVPVVSLILVQNKLNVLSKRDDLPAYTADDAQKLSFLRRVKFKCPKCGNQISKVTCENCGYYPETDGEYKGAVKIRDASNHIGMTKHIILLCITFGIWFLIWVYRTTKFLAAEVTEKKYNAVAELLLCLFIPFYSIYWIRKITKVASIYSAKNEYVFEGAIVSEVFAYFMPVISCAVIQENINIAIVGRGQIA